MTNPDNINTQPSISAAFKEAKNEIGQFFLLLPLDEFIGKSDKEWRGSQTLEHLIKFIETMAQGTGLPKEFMRKRWGYPENKSGSFEDIRRRYWQALEKGAQSPEGYYPPVQITLEVEDYKKELLARWHYANDKLIQNIENWKEKELDEYCVMHPLLGKLTVREMLFCALCHNQGHLNDELNNRV
jgi:hypothetical protein